MARCSPSPPDLRQLLVRLAEAEAELDAIRSGEADAFLDEDGQIRPLVGAERSYLTFFHAMAEGGLTLDADGNVLHCNSRFVALLGQPIEALRGRPFLDHVPEADRARVRDMLASAASTAVEVTLRGEEGGIPVRLSFEPVTLEERQFSCVVVTDLTERVRADAELRIAAIAFESQDGIIVTDARGQIVRVNQAFTRRTGYASAEAIGHTLALLHSGRHSPVFYESMWQELHRRGYWQGEVWNRGKSGTVYAEWLTISAVRDPGGVVTNYVGTYSEIARNREAQAEIYRLAYYDPLTHLPNRRLLHDRLAHAMATSARNRKSGALLFLDIDNLKLLNDALGHDVGDQLLVETSKRIRAALREVDTVARFGGDEFVVILEDLAADAGRAAFQARRVGEKLRAAATEPLVLAGREVTNSVSIGVAVFHGHDADMQALIKRADLALYRAKTAGRNALRFFDTTMQAALDERCALESDLRTALDRDQLDLVYQPQIDAAGRVIGAEALLRWNHPQFGTVMPGAFVPLAEECGLIIPIGEWVARTACDQLRAWSAVEWMRDLSVAVNVSAGQLRDAGFKEFVERLVDDREIDPRRLVLELTESTVLHNVGEVHDVMRELKAQGIGFALDDFGTGNSCLSYLSRLPLDQLKIDRSFVLNLPENRNDSIIAQTIITMATSLGLGVVAEGVETREQHRFLEEHACGAFQGYLFGPPISPRELERRLRSGDFGEPAEARLAA